jgi:hypothetical protein
MSHFGGRADATRALLTSPRAPARGGMSRPSPRRACTTSHSSNNRIEYVRALLRSWRLRDDPLSLHAALGLAVAEVASARTTVEGASSEPAGTVEVERVELHQGAVLAGRDDG